MRLSVGAVLGISRMSSLWRSGSSFGRPSSENVADRGRASGLRMSDRLATRACAAAAIALVAAASGSAVAAIILGTPRADVLRGTPGADVIVGGAGADRIYGRAGNDR